MSQNAPNAMARHVDAAGDDGAEGATPQQITAGGAGGAADVMGAESAAAGLTAPEGAGGAVGAGAESATAEGQLEPGSTPEDQIGARVAQIAEDLRMARNLAEQEDLDAQWRIREEKDRLAAEDAGHRASPRSSSPGVEGPEEPTWQFRQEWPPLAAASQQGPKRRRSTTPAVREATAGEPADPSSGGTGDAGEASAPAAQPQVEFDEHMQRQLAECARGGATTAGARAVHFGDGSAPGASPKPPPPQPAVGTGAGSSNEPISELVPSKPMPRNPPAGVSVRPCAYQDYRKGASSAPQPTPEFIAAFEQQMAEERADRLAAAWAAAARHTPPASAPAQFKPPPAALGAKAPMPSAEAVEAFIAWQAAQQAGKDANGKGKLGPQPFAPLPAGWGQKGKGKGLHGEQFAPRPPSVGRGHSRERHHSRGRDVYGKRSRDEMRDDRMPRPCKKCGSWYVCRTAPENLAVGARHGHCSNPNCERSWGARHGRELPVRDRPTQPDCIVIGGAAPIAPAAAAVPKATPAPAADAAHSDTDVSRSAPVTPNPQIAAQAGPPSAAAVPTAGQVEMVIDWAAVRLMNEQGYQRWLALHQPPAPAGPAPGTPEVVPAAAAVPIVAVPGYELRRVPVTPPDRPAATTTTTETPMRAAQI